MLYHGNSVANLGTMVDVGRALVELCYYGGKSNEGWYKLGKNSSLWCYYSMGIVVKGYFLLMHCLINFNMALVITKIVS